MIKIEYVACYDKQQNILITFCRMSLDNRILYLGTGGYPFHLCSSQVLIFFTTDAVIKMVKTYWEFIAFSSHIL